MKELLFSGADRTILARFNLSLIDMKEPNEFQYLTPLQLLNNFEKELPEDQYKSLSRILVNNKPGYYILGQLKQLLVLYDASTFRKGREK